ncbi:hypothetical protein CVT26_007439 [Gymnopilus dilepis]|uniref:Transmembrane protein n=1 Tax=Gymnopilus dilepis TaxID=231916 RepID=A0A409W7W2_9AGAR|nr:hypothetical protein CVT26_007439 [Gymnopilus dilepis]
MLCAKLLATHLICAPGYFAPLAASARALSISKPGHLPASSRATLISFDLRERAFESPAPSRTAANSLSTIPASSTGSPSPDSLTSSNTTLLSVARISESTRTTATNTSANNFITFTNAQSTQSTPNPTSSSLRTTSSSAVPASVGAVVGVFTVMLAMLCIRLCKRKWNKRTQRCQNTRVVRPFGTPEAASHTHTGSNSVVSPFVITPFDASHAREIKAPALPSSETGILPPTKLADYPTSPPCSVSQNAGVDHQSLLNEIDGLRAQLSQMEALARHGLQVLPASANEDSSEPPPQYDANVVQPSASDSSS